MARSIAQIRDEIQSLSAADQASLLRLLWEELDGPADSGVDEAWAVEAARRDREIESGEIETISAKDVFRELRATLKK